MNVKLCDCEHGVLKKTSLLPTSPPCINKDSNKKAFPSGNYYRDANWHRQMQDGNKVKIKKCVATNVSRLEYHIVSLPGHQVLLLSGFSLYCHCLFTFLQLSPSFFPGIVYILFCCTLAIKSYNCQGACGLPAAIYITVPHWMLEVPDMQSNGK